MKYAKSSLEHGTQVDRFLKRIFRENSDLSHRINPNIFNQSRMYDLAYWGYQKKDANKNPGLLGWIGSFMNAHDVKMESKGTDIETMLDLRFMTDTVIEKYGYIIGLDFTTTTGGRYLDEKKKLQKDIHRLLKELTPSIDGHCIVIIKNLDIDRNFTKLEERAIVTKIYDEIPQCRLWGNKRYINF